ncbi:MAG: HIRAN domain-containing protein, partial [bacterium]|nr:HIRAN domain-containing protein [bacterium]
EGCAYLREQVDLSGEPIEVLVELVREPHNPHDRNAIRVDADGLTIGHIPGEDARKLAKVFDGFGHGVRFRCGARVVPRGATDIGVYLDIVNEAATESPVDDQTSMLLTSELEPVLLWGTGGYPSLDLVGVERHKKAIRDAVTSRGGNPKSQDGGSCNAYALVIDDGKQVNFYIDGKRIGHLPAAESAWVRPVVTRINASGRAAQALVNLWAGTSYVNARVDLASEEVLQPINDRPAQPHVVLPTGKSVQVTGEEAYLDYLSGLLAGASSRSAWATLSVVEGKAGKDLVEIAIDGQVVGRLTPGMSAEFAPAIRAVAGRSKETVVYATIKGSPLKADVTIRATRAGDLTAEWLDRLSR